MSNIVELSDGKFQTTWPVHQLVSKDGHYYEGRPETVAVLAGPGAKRIRSTERVYVGTREACERQL